MHRSALHYDLPPELIADRPVEPRDAARLLVIDRETGALAHRAFRSLGDYIGPDDLLVLNNTRVIPSRFYCRRETGARLEALFVRAETVGWRILLRGGARLQPGETLVCEAAEGSVSTVADDGAEPTRLKLIERLERGEWLATPNPTTNPLTLLEAIGAPPLPPYIVKRRKDCAAPVLEPADHERYQTVYARYAGAIAAPTAGLHFTRELLGTLAASGVGVTEITLHVGVGTFTPIETESVEEHRMHREWFEVSDESAAALARARRNGRRIVAVGTTVCRVLETLARDPDWMAAPTSCRRWTELFLYPPTKPLLVDRLITNFHLPESTLLALVMAFASPDLIRSAYAAAIAERYRFFSYGDAMLIL